jgi:excisionase family DNA binding protein
MEDIFTIKELAPKLRVSELTVRRYLESGRLTGFKVGRVWRITQTSVDAFISENTKTGEQDDRIHLQDNKHAKRQSIHR